MATHIYDSEALKTFGKGIVEVDFEFLPNGSSAPTALKGAHIASVARSAQGVFTLTFNTGFRPHAWLNGWVHARDNANARARVAFVDTVTVSTNPVTAVVCVTDLATPTLQDIAANAASVVKGCLRFKLSPVKDATGHGGL